MIEKTKSNRGGARAGSGRKKTGRSEVPIALRVSALAKERLDAYAKAHGVSAASVVNALLEGLTTE